MRRNNKEVVFVEVDTSRKERLKRAAKVLDKDMSSIAIEAIDEKLDKAARKFPELHREHFEVATDAAA